MDKGTYIRTGRAEVDQAVVQVSYKNSDAVLRYTFKMKRDHIFLEVHSPLSEVVFHVLLPENSTADSVSLNGKDVEFTNRRIEHSCYMDFEAKVEKDAAVKIHLTTVG